MKRRVLRSLAGVILSIAFATAPAAAAEPTGGISPRDLRRQVDAALRQEATAKTTDQRRAAVRDLIELVGTIDAATNVPAADRRRERKRVRGRLAQVRRELERPGAINQIAGRARPPLMAQVGPGAPGGAGPGAPGPAPADHGEDLAELIRQTIAPETWDVNGGNGVIVYFPARRVLVVRQQAEVHWDLADVIGQLQRN